jgi:hypothetical protein
MNEELLSNILSRCLDRMAVGETAAACLAQYPQHADELGPLLAAAVEMSALSSYTISSAGRQRMRAQILSAEVSRNQQRAASWWRWPVVQFGMPRLATVLIVAVLCIVLSTAVVAASQPGDLGYGLRIAGERVPALLARDPEARARAELGIAERRLGDLDRTRSSEGGRFDERAVAALLASAERAAALAPNLPDAQRADIAAHLLAQAEHLARLGDAEPSNEDRATLQIAAAEMRSAAERARAAASPDEPPAVAPVATPTPRPTPTVTSMQPTKPAPALLPTRSAIATSTAQPTHTVAPLRSGLNASATPKRTGPGASATPKRTGSSLAPQAPAPSATSGSARPSATPRGPGPNATPQGPGPSAMPQGPGPDATAQGPGPGATPQGPGPGGTAEAPGATPQGPGAGSTPQGPGPGSTPGGSGH